VKMRWGFIGASWVASTALAPAVHGSSNSVLQAVASRDPSRSASLEPIKVHNSYDELLADPDIDAVYISLANHLHCEWSIKALQAGKHVLCEKPLATNSVEAKLMAEAAITNDRLLVEAIWTRWHPRFERLVKLVESGSVGKLLTVDSAFTFTGKFDGNYRLNPEMGGGSLLDVGPYQIHTWFALMGKNLNFKVDSFKENIGETGVDLTSEISGLVNESVKVSALTSFERPENQSLVVSTSETKLSFMGTEAFTSWKKANTLQIGDTVEEFAPADAFTLMVEAFGSKVNSESAWIPEISESVKVMELLDQF